MDNWDTLNSDNPPDSTYITSKRQSNRTWGNENQNETLNIMDLPRPENVLDREESNDSYLNMYRPSLPQPDDMVCRHDNLTQFIDNYNDNNDPNNISNSNQYYQNTQNNQIALKQQRDSLLSILSNLIYDKCLPHFRNRYDHVFSPYSFYYILLCLLVGSNNKTFAELAVVMGMVKSEILPALTIESIKLHKELMSMEGIKIQILNGFFVDEQFKEHLMPRYISFIKKVGNIHPVNYSNKRQTVSKINGWVKDATRGLIPQLLDGGNINDMTKMIMVNVIYFKASWRSTFSKSETQIKSFHQSSGLKVKIPLMFQESKQLYFHDSKYQMLTLSYSNPNFVMDFILPNKNNNDFPINNMHQFIESYNLHQTKQKVKIYIPKFKQNTRQSLVSILKKQNVKLLFDPYQAELYNIAKYPNNVERIYVSDIIQEAVIIVDEEGTEAAAVTASIMLSYSSYGKEPTIPTFRADRTFQYNVRYLPTNTILFTGVFDGN